MDGGAWWATVHGVAKSWTQLSDFTFFFFYSSFWRGKWQPTPVFLPGESHGWRGLVGCRLWGCRELDTTKQLIHTHTQVNPGNPISLCHWYDTGLTSKASEVH